MTVLTEVRYWMERKLVPVERCVHEKSQGEELVFNDTPSGCTNHLRDPYAQFFQLKRIRA